MSQHTSALDNFIAAWESAAKAQMPPSVAALREAQAPLDHAGFAILGRNGDVAQKPAGKTAKTSYVLLAAGDDHEAIGGHQVGRALDEFIHHTHLARLNTLYDDILRTGQPHRWTCMNLGVNASARHYERVLAPISDDEGDGRCLAGVWIWRGDRVAA